MRAEVRRCRRCKRKRFDDEPAEVMQYKTCAKCRIIERTKKNSRKPLAEETMLYGLKQFREQSQNDNFMEEEGLLNEEYFIRFHNKPFNYEAEINRVLSNPDYVPPIIQKPNSAAPLGIPADTTPPLKYQVKPVKQVQKLTIPEEPILQHKVKKHDVTYVEEIKDEDIFVELAELGNEEELDKGFKYTNSIIDPYAYGNVFDDFQKYLLTLLNKRRHGEDVDNLVFLKEFNDEFTTDMSKYDAHSKDRSEIYSNARLNERQIRSHLISNLRVSYIDPIIAIMGIPYNQESSNINDFKSTNCIRSYHNFIANDKPTPLSEYKKIKSSEISLNYNKRYNLLIIKVNHEIYRPSKNHYSSEFRNKIADIFKKLQFEKTIPNSHLANLRIDFNVTTANLIYDKLFSLMDLFSEEMQAFVKRLLKEDFIADFINYDEVLKISDEEQQEGETPIPEEDEDGELPSEDDLEEVVNDSTIVPENHTPMTKESTVELLDPVLKPEKR
ncbi:uncharacterized protein SPAPADRAFT_60871 [Spathaspora passalidarum NRRL Y-27907]|uniref:Uncharacterized protein n=1 Tax=Spathaspora passalidarum (strain NRRL Y-27907 / 11-Y1) TaxID=619300 RepID=G3AMT3_SPAPN|nr:uncharacterized protein SPAPADRAFT_60871 [Spathaspora passalidarum NRRL Y-27907]EGW33527.1 hypothetical protein SPAPADRAFT_60871 [Spathaspora passalidarum NRRL Y-27907]